jgi:hypothetical protein
LENLLSIYVEPDFIDFDIEIINLELLIDSIRDIGSWGSPEAAASEELREV